MLTYTVISMLYLCAYISVHTHVYAHAHTHTHARTHTHTHTLLLLLLLFSLSTCGRWAGSRLAPHYGVRFMYCCFQIGNSSPFLPVFYHLLPFWYSLKVTHTGTHMHSHTNIHTHMHTHARIHTVCEHNNTVCTLNTFPPFLPQTCGICS